MWVSSRSFITNTMNIPKIKGIIKRRILLNYRVDAEVMREILPHPFRPKLHGGYAIAGICLIRLEQVRPTFLPSLLGIDSENSAHRVAVEWDTEGGMQEGVYVPRRDTDSLLNSLAGGRIFPGVHHHSKFEVNDSEGEIQITVFEKGQAHPLVDIKITEVDAFPDDSVFSSLEESSKFFENGCIGYSARPDSDKLDGLLLKVPQWSVSALNIKSAKSSYFDNTEIFPAGSAQLDHALLMRDIDHEWHSQPMMRSK